MKVVLTSLNAKYIHTNLALRWLYVARDTNFDVEIQEYTIRDDIQTVANKIVESKPDIIGLSIYIWNQEESQELVKYINKLDSSIRIIIGGPEVTFEYEDWLNLPIEGICRGEGEVSFWQACRKELEIEGFVSKTYKSKIPFAKVDLNWLETLECPYFLEMDKNNQKNRYLYFETSRGCPYRCSYCLSSLDNQVRLFSEDYVIKQLKRLETIECKQVKFLDRTFNVKPDRALKIAQLIEKMNVNFSFQFEVVLDTMIEEMLTFFENSNKERFRFEVGVQSFNQITLKAVNRHQDLDKLTKNIKRLSSAGCIMHVDLIGGLPYEDLNSFRESYSKLFACGASEIQVGILKLLKGTVLRKEASNYEFDYSDESPYTIRKTQWLSNEDLNIIEDVYQATEKLYNNGRIRFTLDMCFKWGYPIFDVMAKVGNKIRQFKEQPQIRDYFIMLEEVLSTYSYNEIDIIHALLNTDYYMIFKQTPKPLFSDEINRDVVKSLFKKWIQDSYFNEQTLYNYGKIRLGFNCNQIMYQVLIYDSHQNYPSRSWFNLEGEKQ
ncbi:B12-binding domain-containing radical SAM protein [Anaerorhabdus sp.]|uniref:B12-binding domain-containing radical SAM protein n=1 Tax=Anaerorhabdus sp. TaxID=1872524 RepID=UPI002FC84941